MKKFINQPQNYVTEMLAGIYAAHPDQLTYVDNDLHCLVRTSKKTANKVAIMTGGGSGHLPLFLGYVGQGLLDGCAVGDVFQSPSAEQILNVTKAINQGSGVLYIYGNYTGDIINFDMAAELAEYEDIATATVIGMDDVGSATIDRADKRRGVAGIFFVYKAAGAAAEAGLSLAEVKRVAMKAASATKTIGVALSPCIIPEVGKPSFTISDGSMEIGMGIHGEAGISHETLSSADALIDRILPLLLDELTFNSQDQAAILLNGLGATPLDELYILYRRINEILLARGITTFKVYCGEFATAMEMTGFSLTICKLDDELQRFMAMPAVTPFFQQGSC